MDNRVAEGEDSILLVAEVAMETEAAMAIEEMA